MLELALDQHAHPLEIWSLQVFGKAIVLDHGAFYALNGFCI